MLKGQKTVSTAAVLKVAARMDWSIAVRIVCVANNNDTGIMLAMSARLQACHRAT